MDEGSASAHDRQRTQGASAVGYGIICGLTFPLMISSTFLQEMSLSHGAGDAFGALFFLAYSLTMALTALTSLARPSRHTRSRRLRMAGACAAVFIGNLLMLGRTTGVIEGGWSYAFLASGAIGYGLATTELGWMARITTFHENGQLSLARTVPFAFLCGGGIAALIFYASGATEILFALAIVIVSAVPLMQRQTLEETDERTGFLRGSVSDFVKAVSYLAVFSFAFGTVSQVATKAEGAMPIEAQAVAGILTAAVAMLAHAARRKKAFAASDLYNILFPVVALALVALPFITSPELHVIATTLVFMAFYLTGMNARISVCLLGERDRASVWVYLGATLAISGSLILAGVLFGSFVLAREEPAGGLALVSLVSLFVLALSPVLTARIERRRAQSASMPNEEREPAAASAPTDATTASMKPVGSTPTVAPVSTSDILALQTGLLRRFAEHHGLTPREADVLVLLAQGRTRTYIAAELDLSPNTVKGYIRNIYQKSDAKDKQDLLDRVELFERRSQS
ncbi:helix-turn-helix transcriptional regulator [Gordonibacter sp. An230]|uniref:helix-turn-helix transcriptional regulator n=1 Tax=Gordonibacter sp. An230 TaxID=1965592 RepID=UPI000B38893F|nr:helix-turn-helix transcriptional regulator [Gordonibacter sp. An230]OUO92481.1 helix-turn-helix transcriptional regulator [Gordonibacter sp. An230]